MSETRALVAVPQEWQQIGYSGMFWLEVDLTGEPRDWTRKPVPRQVPGFLLLSVDLDAMTAVVVRKDENAIVDVATGRPKRGWL